MEPNSGYSMRKRAAPETPREGESVKAKRAALQTLKGYHSGSHRKAAEANSVINHSLVSYYVAKRGVEKPVSRDAASKLTIAQLRGFLLIDDAREWKDTYSKLTVKAQLLEAVVAMYGL